MKRKLLGIFGAVVLLLGFSPMARASSFMSVSNGVTTLSCNNSTVAGVTACTSAGFTTSLQSNIIRFTGAVGGYSVTNVTLQGNQPGTLTSAFSLDTKTAVTNVAAGSTSLTIVTASNDYSLPMGSPLALSASQAGTFTQSHVGDQQAYTAFGNAANTLAATGVADSTPACVNPATAPPVQACNTTGISTTFSRSGNFALAGMEVITLAQGDIANFTATASTGGSGVCSGAIGDFVWNDLNHNGIQDAGEPGIPNITVQLFDSSGTILLATTITNANGIYGFSGLCGGTYIVTIPSQSGLTGPGYISTLAFQGNSPANDSNGSPQLSAPPQSAQVILPNNTIDNSIDFGYYVPPSTNACGLTWGYWKNHISAWPVTTLVLGSQTYSQTELTTILGLAVKGDASISLAHQLIAAKLNVANGTDPATAGGNITAADNLLSLFSGKLPYGVDPSSTIGQQMTTVESNLDNFNSDGKLQPGCVQPN